MRRKAGEPAEGVRMRNATIDDLASLVHTRTDLAHHGWTRAAIDGAIRDGVLVRLRRGWYMHRDDHGSLWPQSQHLARVLVAHEDAQSRPVFVLTSAAALHGLPLLRVGVDQVHVHGGEGRRTAGQMVRHRGELADDDVVEVSGIRCTSLERTVADLVRLAEPEVAVACADAAMARIGGEPRRYNADSAGLWREAVSARLGRRGTRGVVQGRAILEMADGRSELPLESVTKLQLRRLGFEQPLLQVAVPAPSGGSFWLDMELREHAVFYECDGDAKYTDPALQGGRSIEQILLGEKHREDWVRGVTGKRIIRGGFAHVASPRALASRLTAFGVVLPPRGARLQLPSAPATAFH